MKNKAEAAPEGLLAPAGMERRYRKSRGYWAKLRCMGANAGPPYLKPSAKVVLYDPRDVDAWFATKRRTSTSDGDKHAPKPRRKRQLKPAAKPRRSTAPQPAERRR